MTGATKGLWAVLILASLQLSHAEERPIQRHVSAPDFLLLQKVVAAVSKKEKNFELSKFDITITEGAEEYFVTFEPSDWKAQSWMGGPPGLALEVVVLKKGTVVRNWYWGADIQR